MTTSLWASVDYALDWPHELLRGELVALIEHPYRSWTTDDVELLLAEAFHTRGPVEDFVGVAGGDLGYMFAPDGTQPSTPPPGTVWINDLLAHLDDIRAYALPAPLWRNRQALAWQARGGPEPDDPREAVAGLLVDLEGDGYLARRFGEVCVDTKPDKYGEMPHRGEPRYRRIRDELQQRLGLPDRTDLWPPAWDRWDDETLYEVIEAVHDLVARPRRHWIHDHDECGRHYEDFDTDAGRRVYRALVSRLLAERGIDLRLATDGPDEGRLVRTVDEARSDLVDRALAAPDVGGGDRVQQAVARFRQRGATPEDKRMAGVALFGVLEQRSAVIKAAAQITTKDESDLYNIANNFALRHQDLKQKREYDPVFLDWMFWWFLAAVEVTNQVLARNPAAAAPASP